jgi:hypothetical protein
LLSELKNRQSERRATARYAIELNVRYWVPGRKVVVSGKGRTVNMSGSGILIATDRFLAPGALIKLEVDWPIERNDVALNLKIGGQVVRSENGATALAGLKILRHEFFAATDFGT